MTKQERKYLEFLWNQGKSKREIARILGRSHSTICRAINDERNWDYRRIPWFRGRKHVVKSFCAEKAQKNFEMNKSRCGAKYKFIGNENLFCEIEKMILQGMSPDMAIGRLKYQGVKVDITARTVYNYVTQGISKVTPFDLRYKLRRKIFRQKKLRVHKRKMGKSIEIRPEIINIRGEFGHWEGDCIVDKDNNAILVCIERVSRCCVLRKLERHDSYEVLKELKEIKKLYCMKSITVDNGSEFYKITQLEDQNFEVYFTRPYSSFEKGSVENLNGIIRRFIPKGSDLSALTQEMVNRVQNQVNDYPRKILGYMTAQEKFDELRMSC